MAQNIDRLFILTGILFILCGMALGLHMGSSQDYTLRPVHAHLNLLGFTLMFLYGLAYHVWPAMKGTLALVHYALHLIGTATSMILLVLVLGDPATNGPTLGPITDAFAAMTTLGVLLFAYLFFTKAKN